MSPGLKILWLYLSLTYLVPCFFHTFLGLSARSVSGYRIYPHHGWALAFVLILGIVLYLFNEKQSIKETERPDYRFPNVQKFRIFFSLGLLLVSLIWSRSGTADYRYAEESAFSNGLSLLYIAALVPTFMKFDLFYHVYFSDEGSTDTEILNSISRLAGACALFLTINGTVAALFAFCYLFYALFPMQFRLLFTRAPVQNSKMLVILAAPFFLLAAMGTGWFWGETVKRGGDSDSVLMQTTDISFAQWAIYWMMDRASSSYYSFLMTLNDYVFRLDLQPFENLFIPIKTIAYRVDVLLGRPFLIWKPNISSICRLNYEMLSYFIRDREGTSPGLIAGFLLTFPFPISFAALLTYCICVMRFMNRLVHNMRESPNLAGMLLITWFCLVFFESPVDLLVLVDDTTIFLFLICALYFKSKTLVKQASRHQPSVAERPRARINLREQIMGNG